MKHLQRAAGASALLFAASFYVGLTALVVSGTIWACRVILSG